MGLPSFFTEDPDSSIGREPRSQKRPIPGGILPAEQKRTRQRESTGLPEVARGTGGGGSTSTGH